MSSKEERERALPSSLLLRIAGLLTDYRRSVQQVERAQDDAAKRAGEIGQRSAHKEILDEIRALLRETESPAPTVPAEPEAREPVAIVPLTEEEAGAPDLTIMVEFGGFIPMTADMMNSRCGEHRIQRAALAAPVPVGDEPDLAGVGYGGPITEDDVREALGKIRFDAIDAKQEGPLWLAVFVGTLNQRLRSRAALAAPDQREEPK